MWPGVSVSWPKGPASGARFTLAVLVWDPPNAKPEAGIWGLIFWGAAVSRRRSGGLGEMKNGEAEAGKSPRSRSPWPQGSL